MPEPSAFVRFALVGTAPDSGPAPEPPTRQPVEMSFVRAWLGPLLLLTVTPTLALLVPIFVRGYGSSFGRLLSEGQVTDALSALPMPSARGAALILGWLVLQAVLLRLLPGPTHLGPVTPMGQRPPYRKNGVITWIVTHVLWLVLGPVTGLLPVERLYDVWGEVLATSNVLALLFCAFLYWKGRTHPSTPDVIWTGRPLFDFFQGLELHPRLFGLNLKQLINCRYSMMGWSIAVCSFAYAQGVKSGHISTGMWVCAALQVAYLFKFFLWETGYFGSLDIMHDRFGYYICWGVLVWVPAVYCLAAYSLVERPLDWPLPIAIAVALLGLLSLFVNWAADDQRQRVRESGGTASVWGKPPVLIAARYRTGDGEQRENLLLASGYWGIARHFHYVPELTLAFLWCLPSALEAPAAMFYVIFLTILLVDRARRDEKRCAAKYGADWDSYKQAVRWRMVPGLW